MRKNERLNNKRVECKRLGTANYLVHQAVFSNLFTGTNPVAGLRKVFECIRGTR